MFILMDATLGTMTQLNLILNPPEEEKRKEPEPEPTAHKPPDFRNRETPKYRKKPLNQIFKGYKNKRN
jgi:hypothetical protein